MSKQAHSNEEAMAQIEANARTDDRDEFTGHGPYCRGGAADCTCSPEYRENLAEIAEALMESTAQNCPGWHPADCPSEIVVDLVNERDEFAAEARNVRAELDRTKGDARCALKDLTKAYVNLLEVGRDRIVSLGGECDSVEKMETGDPALIQARAVIQSLQPTT